MSGSHQRDGTEDPKAVGYGANTGDRAGPFHALDAAGAARALAVDPASGLARDEAERRLRRDGPNALAPPEPVTDWTILKRQFASIVVVLLVVAMVMAGLVGEVGQAVAIAIVLAINAAIGFVTEKRAIRSMDALRKLGALEARVRRDGTVSIVPADTLVVGDIVVLEAGDAVSADMRILTAAGLRADESTLTGESVPVAKSDQAVGADCIIHERSSMLYRGTAVTNGSAQAVVVATGQATEIGRIASLAADAHSERTPLERQLQTLAHQLVWVTIILAGLIAVIGFLADKPWLLMVQTSVALAVAAIPEGLPIVATLALARGVLRMSRRNAVVNRLASVETLGATTTILTDKTGTLTLNQMVAHRLVTADGDWNLAGGEGTRPTLDRSTPAAMAPSARRALEVAALCTNASLDPASGTAVGDPVETALLEAAFHAGIMRTDLLAGHPELLQHPFDGTAKMMATVHAWNGDHLIAVKGAPEAVLSTSVGELRDGSVVPLDPARRDHWTDLCADLARAGYRLIALAYRDGADLADPPYQNLTWAGVVALSDPPRADVRDAITACHRAGIDVVMVTGDHPHTAASVGRSIGLSGPDEEARVGLAADSASGEDLDRRLFARVTPKEKLDLITLYQGAGHVVAMTGDGVNDAPALNKADIGIAMGKRGTQVARDAADIVLLDDAFSTIVVAIREGRVIFGNLRRFSHYLLSCNLAEILIVGLAVASGLPLPLLPLQILFLNIVTDVFPAFALATGEGGDEVIRRPPRPPGEPILGPPQWRSIALQGLAMGAATLGAMILARSELGATDAQATTIAFLTLALTQLWHVFNMRDHDSGLFINDITRNPYVWAALLLCLGLLGGVIVIPAVADVLSIAALEPMFWALIVAASLVPLVAGQLLLVARRHWTGARPA